MSQSKHREDGASGDLFAERIPAGHSGAADCTLAEGRDAEHFLNAYAEASQARASGKRLLFVHHGSLGDSNQSATTGTNDKAIHGQSLAKDRGQTDTAHLEPAEVMPEEARAGKEHPRAVAVPRMMTAAEVAAYVRVSVSKVWRSAKQESDIPSPVRIGGSTRWDRQAIDRYLDSLQHSRHSGR
jgi:predicted DNA-binding transcriptional regulator AlpA